MLHLYYSILRGACVWVPRPLPPSLLSLLTQGLYHSALLPLPPPLFLFSFFFFLLLFINLRILLLYSNQSFPSLPSSYVLPAPTHTPYPLSPVSLESWKRGLSLTALPALRTYSFHPIASSRLHRKGKCLVSLKFSVPWLTDIHVEACLYLKRNILPFLLRL